MFCYQCEQTVNGGCTVAGNCGKDSETGELQDLLLYVTLGISMYAHLARKLNDAKDPAIDRFVIQALFTTVTNVDFDAERIEAMIREAGRIRDVAKSLYSEAAKKQGQAIETLTGPAQLELATSRSELMAQGQMVSIAARQKEQGETIVGLQELIKYGVLGAAAYADHAKVLNKEDDAIYASFHEILDYLASNPSDADELLGKSMETGQLNLKVMELLDQANTGTYGHPEPSAVKITSVPGKAILVSGHDLKDLELLLKQTEGKGINIYTHGEMLPANAYPNLKSYKHLIGNYGGAWQDQRQEFEDFPGAILMTTNCIQRPQDSYKARIFTTGLVAWPGVTHIDDNKDFSPVIEAALQSPGFTETESEKTITVGFGHQAVLGVADKVIDAVKAGQIKHFYLIGGCDGAKSGRNYYTEAAQAAPKDSVILTLACGKFRFNKMEFGDIGGIPRLLDIGQCNDAYSAIKIASALADAFGTDVNGLPLTFLLSWYEQKAVAILLTLLSLGIKNMKLGPTLPAFLTDDVVGILVDKFQIAPVSTPEKDMNVAVPA